jgi:hypothetical protein
MIWESFLSTNKDRLCECSEPQSIPLVGRARLTSLIGLAFGAFLYIKEISFGEWGLDDGFLS